MLKCIVTGQKLSVRSPLIASGSYAYLTAEISFTADWDGCTSKYAYFERDGSTHTVDIVDNRITEDKHLDLPEGIWDMYIVGYNADGTQRITTGKVELHVERVTLGFPGLEPDIVEQKIVQISAMRDETKGYMESAEAAQEAAAQSEINAALSAEDAQNSAVSAASASQSAGDFAKDAESSRDTALRHATSAGEAMEAAQVSANKAEENKAIAETAATNASNSADTATSAAAQAEGSASNASRDAASASGSAQSAAASAQTASNAADSARNSTSTATAAASTATAKASAAAGSASAAQSAQNDAETAKASAESAKTAAETAQNAAEEARDAAAASATSAAQSARTATDKAQVIAESADKINAVQRQVNNNERSLNALWKLNEGQIYDIEQKEESGMNNAPSGAKYMSPEEIYGKTEQETTNGYQLVDISDLNEEPVSGVQCLKNADGSITLSGSRTGTMPKVLDTITLTADTTYTINVFGSDIVNAAYIIQEKVPAGTSDRFSVQKNCGATYTFTAPRDMEVEVGLKGVANGTVSGIVFVMLNEGAAKDWETFTGGIPAPNPDYQQEIHNITSITIDHDGTTRTIISPKPLNALGEYRDMLDVTDGVWRYVFKQTEGGSLRWVKIGGGDSTFRATLESFPFQKAGDLPGIMSTDYRRVSTKNKQTEIDSSGDMIITCHSFYNGFFINDSRFTNLEAFTQAIKDKTFIYAGDVEETVPIDPDDLDFLRSLACTPADNTITVTDQDGNDIPWLNEYIISLREVVSND